MKNKIKKDRKEESNENLIGTLKSLIGLFIPVPRGRGEKTVWGSTISIGSIPIGWVMVAIALAVHFIF